MRVYLHITKQDLKNEHIKQAGMKMMTQKEFIKYIDKHPELQETLIRNVEDSLGDYVNFNKTERTLIKKTVPFYAWYRTVARWTAKLSAKDPARLALIYLAMNKIESEDYDLKEYQRGAVRFGVDERSGKQIISRRPYKFDTLETVTDLKRAVTGEDGAARLPFITQTAKIPMEAAAGKHDFRGGELTSKRYSRQYYNNKPAIWDSEKHDWLRDENGNPTDITPASVRANYLLKELGYKTMFPAANSIVRDISNIYGNDKAYDADFGGYRMGDFIDINELDPEKKAKIYQRYAANDLSPRTKTIKVISGLDLQNENPVKDEELENARYEYYKRKKEAQRMINLLLKRGY